MAEIISLVFTNGNAWFLEKMVLKFNTKNVLL